MDILGVDSGQFFRTLMANLFLATGVKATLVNTGKEALATLKTHEFNLICLSRQLEDMDGLALVSEIRNQHQLENIPIILFTSDKSKDLQRKALALGVTDIIYKSDINQLENYLLRYQKRLEKLNAHVIYIEDSISQQQTLTHYLTEMGLTVSTFNNAEDAWQTLLNEQYDLVITDIVLAGETSGLQLVNQIRRLNQPMGDVPILAISAYDDSARRIDLLNRGVNDYVSKPVCYEELIARVRGLIVAKQMKDLLMTQKEELQKESRDKLVFLASISHEIRTPLNGILGMIHLIDKSSLPEYEQKCLQTAEDSGEVLLSLVNDVLDLMKAATGNFKLHTEAFSLRDAIESLMALNEDAAKKKNIQLSWQMDNKVPDTIVTDPVRFKQVVNNLLTNAIKFTHEDYISLSITYHGFGAQKGMIHIEIEDSGPGIELSRQESIFDHFQQAGNQPLGVGGSGLGLAIAKRIVESWQGEIGVRSIKGEGSCFWFTLPVTPQRAHGEPRTGSALPSSGSSSPPSLPIRPEWQSRNFLIVEDNAVNQKVTQGFLTKLGIQSTIAENGREALNLISRFAYDCILMDCQMPLLDGIETTKIIRSEFPDYQNTPIIALTAHALADDESRCKLAGMNAFITKPFKLKTLIETLNALPVPH
ncbi:MAG: response regulator [Hahellaceae bacterium]|nr:response regulator [Hahellaceae bacterium]